MRHRTEEAEAKGARPAPAALKGHQISLRQLVESAIAEIGPDYVLTRRGTAVAVIHLLGSDPAITDGQALQLRLGALQDFLEKNEEPMMRISSSAPQPMEPYLATLEASYVAELKDAPHLAARLRELARTMERLRETGQVRVGVEYWVLTLPPSFASFRLGQPRGAGRAQLQRALDDRCNQLLWACERAHIQARRLDGEALAALCISTWEPPALLDETLRTLPQAPETLEEAVKRPTGTLLVAHHTIQTSSGFVRCWYVQDFAGPLSPALLRSLAEQPGMRILQFWEQVPLGQVKRVLRFNRTVEGSSEYLRPAGDVRDFDSEARMQRLDAQRARIAFHGEKVFRYRALLQVWAQSLEELEARAHALEVEIEKANLLCHVATFRQREALASGLPLAVCQLEKPERNLDAQSLSALVYPGPRDPLEARGIWLGQTLPAGQLVTRDLFALQTPVIECIGIMGSGKSTFQKLVLTQLAAQGRRCFVLDSAQHEYHLTIEALQGTTFALGQADGPVLNPLHFDPLDATQEGDPFAVGVSLFLGWLAAALDAPLSAIERVAASSAYVRALEGAGIRRMSPATWHRRVPVLADFCAALAEEPSQPSLGSQDPAMVAQLLAYKLSPFAQGIYAPLFNRRDDLDLGQAQVVCFDLFDVPDDPRRALFYQLLSFIQRQALRHERYQGNLLLIDEGHFALEEESSAAILQYLARNARKAGLLTLISRHSQLDSEANGAARFIHRTAGATALFGVNPQDEATLADLHLSPYEKALAVAQLTHPGQCLWITPHERLRLQVLLPPAWASWFETRAAVMRTRQEHTLTKGDAVRQHHRYPAVHR